MSNKYYSLNQSENEATLVIYGNITSYDWREKDISAYTLSKQLDGLDVNTINVYINSYGGEVAEGLAIYNSLKRHKAKVKTYCDGFACSIASVVFMAGDERIMSNASLLMIHNAWRYTAGNANQLRKQAEDLEKMTQASINVYMEEVNITEEELKQLLDEETWLTPQDAFEKGFATTVINERKSNLVNQDVRNNIIDIILHNQEKIKENRINSKILEMQQQINSDDGKEPKQDYMGSFFNIFK